MGKKADKLRRRFEHRLEELSEQLDEVLALVQPEGEPLAAERAAFEARARSIRERMVDVHAEIDQSRIAFESSLAAVRQDVELQTDEEVARWSTAANGRIDDALRAVDEHADAVAGQVERRTGEVLAAADRTAELLAGAERTAAEVQERSRQCLDDAGVLEVGLRRRVAEIDARSADSLATFESSLAALRERAHGQTDQEVARWSTAANGRIDDALRAVDEHADVVAGQVERRTGEVLAAADRTAELLAVAERTAAEVQERSRQCVDDVGALEAELRRRVAEVEAEVDESRVAFVLSLAALHERAEAQSDEEVARWSTAANGRIDDALRAVDEQADVAAGLVERRAAEVQERARQCVDDVGVLEAELRRRVAEVEAEVDESRVAFVLSLVALHERAEAQSDEEVARWSTAANGRIDDALRAVDEQADVAAGLVASRGAEILAVAERTVAEVQERARQRLDETDVLEDELRARLTEQADAMAARVASRVEEILSAAERAVAEAEERARGVLDHQAAAIEQPALEAPKDVTPELPAPAEVLVWRALSEPDSTDALWEPLTNRALDGGDPPPDDDHFFGRMAAELRDEASHSSALATATRTEAAQEATAEPMRRRPLKVRASLAALVASTEVLARSAADERLRIELVHVAAGGRADSFLRLTAYNMSGWWEYHDVPVQTTGKTPQSAVVDLGELANALQHERLQSGDAEVEIAMDGDLTIGTTLLLAHPDLDPILPYHRDRIEHVDLGAADRSGLIVETQIGRVSISPRLVSFLRSRNYRSSEILSVDGEPCLAAQIAGPTEGTTATIVTRLREAGAPLDENDGERRNAAGTEVTQLVRALSPDTTGEELEQILDGGVGYARRRAAAHPALPPAVIRGLINDGTEAIRAAAASNPSADEASCTLAAADGSEIVRAALAANRAVTAECLVQLAADPVAHVRELAATNAGVTGELLVRLAEDADSSVRAAAAAHPDIDPETLFVLAHDPDSRVCAAVASNPSCPSELLSELLALVPDAVLANPSAPSTVLAAGSRIDARQLRTAVAANLATPSKQLQSLARDGDPEVVRAVVENPSTPPNVRRRARRRLGSLTGDSVEAR